MPGRSDVRGGSVCRSRADFVPTSRRWAGSSEALATICCLMSESPLKTLADASLEVTAAEAAVEEGAHHTASEALDRVDVALAALRAAWPDLAAPERAVVGPSAKGLKERSAAARRRIPRLRALSIGTAEHDPDEEDPPH